MVLLTRVLVVVANAKQGVMRIMYMLLVMEDIPVAVSPIFSISTKNTNHTLNEKSLCIIVGVDICRIPPISPAVGL